MDNGFDTLREWSNSGEDRVTLDLGIRRMTNFADKDGHRIEWNVAVFDGKKTREARLTLWQPGRLTLFLTPKEGFVGRLHALEIARLPKNEDWDLFQYEMNARELDEEVNLKFHSLEVAQLEPANEG